MGCYKVLLILGEKQAFLEQIWNFISSLNYLGFYSFGAWVLKPFFRILYGMGEFYYNNKFRDFGVDKKKNLARYQNSLFLSNANTDYCARVKGYKIIHHAIAKYHAFFWHT